MRLSPSARREIIAFKLSSRLQQMDSAVRLLFTRTAQTSPGPSTAATWMTIRSTLHSAVAAKPFSERLVFQMEDDQALLADKDRQISEYKQHVAEQESKLAELSAKGSPPEDAVDLLKQFKETLRIAEEQRKFLLRKMRGEAQPTSASIMFITCAVAFRITGWPASCAIIPCWPKSDG